MEHEDNAQFENFLKNSQNNRLENLHLGSTGVAVVNANELGPCLEGEIVVDAGNNVLVVGQKSDGGEHDDDEEEKYIKEVQQSEKQQHQQQQQQHQENFVVGSAGLNVDDDDDDDDDEDPFVVGNTNNNKADGNEHHQHDINIGLGGVGGFVVGNGGNGSGGDHNEEDELFLKTQQTSTVTHGNGDFRGFGAFSLDDEDVEVINSTTSNTETTTTASTDEIQLGDIGIKPADLNDEDLRNFLNPNANNDGYNAAEVLRQEQLLQQLQTHNIHDDDDEPSSVATTYGTSSLSENQTPFDQEPLELNNPEAAPLEVNNAPLDQPENQAEINFETFDNNKENNDPANIENHRPNSFLSELHSELNPNATEFVPSFGSQPTSPTTADEAFDGQQEEQQQQENIFGDGTPRPASKDVARRLLGVIDDDDLVAASPRKGLGENMDAISLPEEIEFEHEADQRPHGAEQDDNLFGGEQQPELEQQQQNQLENGQNNLHLHEELGGGGVGIDSLDFQQRQSPASSFIDHGPETSVDLELNAGAPGEDDVMNKSMYGEQLIGDNDTNADDSAVTRGDDDIGVLSPTPIADILNSVQMLPQEEEEDDSHNNFFEEQQQQELHHKQPSSEDYVEQPSSEDQQEQPSLEDHQEQPLSEGHHEQPSLEDHHEQPSLEDHHEQTSVEDHHEQISVGDHHEQPSVEDHHEQPFLEDHQEQPLLEDHQEKPLLEDLHEQPTSEDHHQQQHDVHDVDDDDEELSGFNIAGHVVAEGSKELLNVEEKELVSHSPSTEELQLNLQNEMHSSHKDIPQLPIDALENVNNMQESFYFEHTSSTNANANDDADDTAAPPPAAAGIHLEQPSIDETSLLFDTSIPQEVNASSLLLNDSSLLSGDDNIEDQTQHQIVFSAPAPHDLGLVPETAAVVDITPSPLSTAEEKHLIEDTKEQEQEQEKEHKRQQDDEQLEQSEHELVQQMDALLLSGDVGASSQESTEQAAELFTATNVNNIQNAGANPFAIGGEHSKYEFAQPSAAEQAFEGQILLEEAQEEEQKRHDFEQHQQNEQDAYNETPLEAAVAAASPVPAEPESSDDNIEKAPEPEAIVVATEEKEVAAAAPIESAPPAVEKKENDAVTPEIAVAAATAVAAAAVAATVAAVAVSPTKTTSTKTPSSDSVKKTKSSATSVAARAKVGGSSPLGAKKLGEVSKKSTTSTTSAPAAKPIAAARPRTAPSTVASKVGSSTTTTIGSKTSSTASTRKPLTSSSAASGASKVAPPRTTNTTRPATAPAAGLGAKPAGAASRTTVASRLTTIAARKPATTSATNGVSSSVGAPTAASKARTSAAAGGVGAKPNTLGINSNTGSGAPGAAKLKLSPRSTLSSQLRKTAPPSATSGARSPLKTSATSASNKSSTVSSTTSTAASRAKGGAATSLTTTTTTTTKTFTARPAPKTTHTSNTLNNTRRPYSGGNTTSSSTTTTTSTTRRVSPLKSSSLANKSPTKGSVKSTTPLKTQAKEPIAKSSPNSSLLKGVKKTAVSSPKTAGAAATNGQATKVEQQQQPAEEQKKLQQQDPLIALNGNGLPHDGGDDSLPEPTPPGAAQPDPSSAAALLDF